MIQCKNCGRDIPANSKVCPYCGNPVISGGASGFHAAGNIDGKMPPAKRPTGGAVGGSPATEHSTIKSTFGAAGGSSAGGSFGGGGSGSGSSGGGSTGTGVYTGRKPTIVPDEVSEPTEPLPRIKSPSAAPRRNVAQEVLSKVCASPVFVIAAICLTAGTILQFVGNMINATGFTDWIVDLIRYTGEIEFGRSLRNVYSVIFTASSVIGALPGIITALGLWLLFSVAKSEGNGSRRLSALSAIRAAAFIKMVFMILGFGVMAVSLAIVQISIKMTADEIVPPLVIATVVIVLIGILLVVYQLKIAQTVGGIHSAVQLGTPPSQGSVFVGVFCIILAVLGLLATAAQSLLVGLLEEMIPDIPLFPTFIYGNPASTIGGVISPVAMIFLSVLLFMYNGRVRRPTV